VAILVDEHQLPVQRACRIAGLSRAAHYAPPHLDPERDTSVITALQTVVAESSRWGFWKCFDRLRLLGHGWNHKRVHRVYCALRLNLPRRTKRRVPTRPRLPLDAPRVLNGTWALDFMHDALYDGRRFRMLNVLDEGNREALAVEIGTSLASVRVVGLLEPFAQWREWHWPHAIGSSAASSNRSMHQRRVSAEASLNERFLRRLAPFPETDMEDRPAKAVEEWDGSLASIWAPFVLIGA
jgi:hypothetical protein